MGIGSQDDTAFAFEGRWGEFLPIALTNSVLTIATLGIYRFWATTRERDYLWSRTRFIDDNLEWTGKGMELFFGFVLALLLFGLPFFLITFATQALILQGYGNAVLGLTFVIYLLLFYLVGFAIFRGLRYRLSRTSWHGIHGGSDDQGWQYGLNYLWKNALAYLCLALLFPWAMTSLWKDRWEAMSFGPHRFESNPKWSSLMGRYLIAYIAPFVILVGLVAAAIFAAIAMGVASGSGDDPPAAMIAVIVVIVLVGFYVLWPLAALAYYSAYIREVMGTMTLSTLEFAFTARTRAWIWLFLGNAAFYLAAFALAAIPIGAIGLYQQFLDVQPGGDPIRDNPIAYAAFIIALLIPFVLVGPFVRYRNWRFFIQNMEAGGEINLSELTQSTTAGMRQGEGLLDAFDMGAI